MAGPFEYAYSSAQSVPFRVRGTQVQVITNTNSITSVADALVYLLPHGQTRNQGPMINGRGQPFLTDQHGYLHGRGAIAKHDTLVALLPIELSPITTEYFGDAFRLYYTNARPDESGLDADHVDRLGVQQLLVSKEAALVLFDLDISLEWDARQDTLYMAQLRSDLLRTSRADI